MRTVSKCRASMALSKLWHSLLENYWIVIDRDGALSKIVLAQVFLPSAPHRQARASLFSGLGLKRQPAFPLIHVPGPNTM
jgi:hypothetical protein